MKKVLNLLKTPEWKIRNREMLKLSMELNINIKNPNTACGNFILTRRRKWGLGRVGMSEWDFLMMNGR